MSFIIVGVAATSGLTKIGMALAGRKKRIAEQKAANKELQQRRDAYESLDTSNPYLNMENTMEDLTVNQQQAQFQKDMAQQQQSNMLGSMQQSGGFNAGNIQAMVNAGSNQARQASASIGQQEAQNQKAERSMAGQIQAKERAGDVYSRGQKKDKVETLFGMSMQRSKESDEARQRAGQMIASGVGDFASAGIGTVQAGQANMAEGLKFFGGQK
jgi:hypothetical protein|tara:strand:- start:3510 stop:4151 length:642 start_codon:yes stop_codon:yes gene_type:complete